MTSVVVGSSAWLGFFFICDSRNDLAPRGRNLLRIVDPVTDERNHENSAVAVERQQLSTAITSEADEARRKFVNLIIAIHRFDFFERPELEITGIANCEAKVAA